MSDKSTKGRVTAIIEFEVPADYEPMPHNAGDGRVFGYAYEELNDQIDGLRIVKVLDEVEIPKRRVG